MDKTLSLDLQQTDFGRGLDKEIKRLDGRIDTEADARSAADQEIWTEIEAIEAASDVVDVVGTHAELESYDTSALKDNDIIKVLQDETHDDAVAYYRWDASTEAFTFVGVEGPYYTASETDTLLADKQDKLIAGSNIQIASDGKTISATDTTYTAGTNVQINDNVISATDTTYTAGTNVSIDANNVISATDTTYTHFTGATASADGTQGLVPAPVAGDEDKVLKGDGTWGTVQSGVEETILYYVYNGLYKDSAGTMVATGNEVKAACEQGVVLIDFTAYSSSYQTLKAVLIGYDDSTSGTLDFQCYNTFRGPFEYIPRIVRFSYINPSTAQCSIYVEDLQYKIQAGSHISIANGRTISANYSDMTGATASDAGVSGLVPAPAAGDDTKFLSGDGTWKTASGVGYSAGYGINIDANNEISADQTVLALRTDLVGKQDVLTAGSNITISGNTISATDTTYSTMTGATSSAAGASGLVPAPAAGDDTKFLRGDGTWGTVATNALLIKEWS